MLTTVMPRIVVDKSTDHAKPPGINPGFVRVLENLESPGILLWKVLEKGHWSWKVLEIY